MNKVSYKYLSIISFKSLFNWSVKSTQKSGINFKEKFPKCKIKSFLKRSRDLVTIIDTTEYNRVTVRLYGKGILIRDSLLGKFIGSKKQYRIKSGQFLLSRIDARNGAFGIVPESCNNCIITNDFWAFDINEDIINPQFLFLVTATKQFSNLCQLASSGTTNRQRVAFEFFENTEIPLPPIGIQKDFVKKYNDKIKLAKEQEQNAKDLEKNIEKYIFEMLGLEINKNTKCAKLQFVNFINIKQWGADKIAGNNAFISNKYKLLSLSDISNLYINIFRGKSPKYEDNTEAIILNQKCNRWNSIDLKFAKTVSVEWLKSIDGSFKTKENDVLVNSTGEGTIGRATCIDKEYIDLLYDSHILLLRLNTELVNPLYYTYLLNSNFGQEQINYIKSAQSTKQTELGIDNLKLIKFPYPELEVQNEMVEHIKELNENIINLRKQAEQNRILAQQEFERELFK